MWFVSHVVQTLAAPNTFFFTLMVQKSHGDANPVAEACVFRRHASLKNVCSASTSTLGAKILNLSWSNTQVVPIVAVAICVGTTVTHPGDGMFTDTRSLVLTPPCLRFAQKNNGLGLAPRSLSRIEFGQCLLQIELNKFTFVRSDPFVKPQKGYHFGVKIILVSVRPLPVELVQVIWFDSRLGVTDQFCEENGCKKTSRNS